MKMKISIVVGSILVIAGAWWFCPVVSDAIWEMSEPIKEPMEWDLGESRARYAAPKDGQGEPLLLVSDAMLNGETRLSIKEAEQILDSNEAWAMMSEKGRVNLIENLKSQAEHPVAQYLLGVCYNSGRGVEQSTDEAIAWWRKAAERGCREAQCNLGGLLLQINGGDAIDAEGVEWLHKAARQGDVFAQSNLGLCYKNGIGVKQSLKLASRWYRRAAKQGDWKSFYELGKFYEMELGVRKSAKKAVYWFRKAEEYGLDLPEDVQNYIKENEK